MTTTLVLVATTKTPSAILVSIPCEQAFPVYTGCCWSLHGAPPGRRGTGSSHFEVAEMLYGSLGAHLTNVSVPHFGLLPCLQNPTAHTVHNPKDVLTTQIQSSPSFFYEPTQTTKEVPKLIYYIPFLQNDYKTARHDFSCFRFLSTHNRSLIVLSSLNFFVGYKVCPSVSFF